MLKTLVVLALAVAVLVPAGVAFAEENSGADHPILVSNDVAPAGLQSGEVAGSDKAQRGPYFELRLDNWGQ